MKLVTRHFTIRIMCKDKDFYNVIGIYTKRWSMGVVKWYNPPEYEWKW